MVNMTQILTQRVHLLMSAAELQAVDDWSFANRIRSRGEAVRRLIEMAIRPERDAPANAIDRTIPTIPGARSGPYPWLAPELQNATKALNVRVPARLKAQIDWIIRQREDSGQSTSLQRFVADALQEHAVREMRARGIGD
jgi:metal-responsive CopG/Arc/MetJ family transcriptional regulator